MSLGGSFHNKTHAHRSKMQHLGPYKNAHPHRLCSKRDNGNQAECSSIEASTGQFNPIKASRTHQELHKELLLAHKKGLALSSRTELHQVLERRKRELSDKKEEEETRSPLEEVLLKRQQTQVEKEKQEEEKVREETQLFEFVRVRQNLRKIHTVTQHRTSNSQGNTDEK